MLSLGKMNRDILVPEGQLSSSLMNAFVTQSEEGLRYACEKSMIVEGRIVDINAEEELIEVLVSSQVLVCVPFDLFMLGVYFTADRLRESNYIGKHIQLIPVLINNKIRGSRVKAQKAVLDLIQDSLDCREEIISKGILRSSQNGRYFVEIGAGVTGKLQTDERFCDDSSAISVGSMITVRIDNLTEVGSGKFHVNLQEVIRDGEVLRCVGFTEGDDCLMAGFSCKVLLARDRGEIESPECLLAIKHSTTTKELIGFVVSEQDLREDIEDSLCTRLQQWEKGDEEQRHQNAFNALLILVALNELGVLTKDGCLIWLTYNGWTIHSDQAGIAIDILLKMKLIKFNDEPSLESFVDVLSEFSEVCKEKDEKIQPMHGLDTGVNLLRVLQNLARNLKSRADNRSASLIVAGLRETFVGDCKQYFDNMLECVKQEDGDMSEIVLAHSINEECNSSVLSRLEFLELFCLGYIVSHPAEMLGESRFSRFKTDREFYINKFSIEFKDSIIVGARTRHMPFKELKEVAREGRKRLIVICVNESATQLCEKAGLSKEIFKLY